MKAQDDWNYEEAQQALAVSEARLRDALAVISEAFALYDSEGRLITCNQKFRDLYGYTEEEARPGVHFRELGKIDVERGNVVIGDDQGGGEAYLERKAEYRRRLEGSFIVKLRDGRWLNTTDRRTTEGGFVSIQSDITELKQAEEAMAVAKRQAEIANQAKSEFLANMSHELRTPLNSILGFSELVAQPGFAQAEPEKVQDYAEMIHRAGSLLLDLINDVLDLSKIEAGQAKLQEEEVEVATVLRQCMALVKPKADRIGLTMTLDVAEYLPPLSADPRYVKQVVLNLLSNAVKFTPEDGRIEISVSLEVGGGLSIAISDSGIGIAPEDIESVLQPFGQVAESYQRAHEGTGLGLPICASLMNLHGGRLDMTSEPGKGTTVTARFPAERVLPGDGPQAAGSAG